VEAGSLAPHGCPAGRRLRRPVAGGEVDEEEVRRRLLLTSALARVFVGRGGMGEEQN